jgi:hypothetical protein
MQPPRKLHHQENGHSTAQETQHLGNTQYICLWTGPDEETQEHRPQKIRIAFDPLADIVD